MEITDIRTRPVDRWLFVEVETDAGIIGIGESGTWGFLEASEGAIETFKRYLIGKDPLRIDHHWQYMYRNAHFRGAAIMGAISAIDVALWDIAGKHFDAPVYQLLGGKCRDRARVYVHVLGETAEDLVEGCIAAKEQGFTAVGHLSPLLDEPRTEPYFETQAGMVRRAADRVRRYREAVGDDVDLCIEIHRRLDPHEAIQLGREIEQYHPMFYEDPIQPDNFDEMAAVARKVDIPIATGERLHTAQEFEMLLKRDAVSYVRPDVCLAGGITHVKKIAAVAEAHDASVVPHNPLGPVSTAACLQIAAAIPNFSIQEYPFRPTDGSAGDGADNSADGGEAPGERFMKSSFDCEDGFVSIPDGPGIGIELDRDALDAASYEPRTFRTRLHEDGSVVDQ